VQRASGVPHALFGREIINASGALRREGASVRLELHVIASAAKQSILSYCGAMDCFASLAMTVSCDHRATLSVVVAREGGCEYISDLIPA
jgi:hypothetical protein